MIPNVLTDSATEPLEAGKDGEGGVFEVTNADFVAAVFPRLPEGAFAAACSKSGDPGLGDGRLAAPIRWRSIFLPRLTTSSGVRASIPARTARSKRAKPSLPPAIS